MIIFTSGTTGKPRGVVYPQRYLTGQRLQAEHWFGAREGELAWCTAATGWSKSARNVFIAPWLCGAAALIHDGRFDPVERLAIAEREGVNVLCQAPTEYRMVAKRAELRPMSGMRHLVSAGAAEPRGDQGVPRGDRPGDPRRLRADRDRPGRGHAPDEDPRDGSMGRPLPGIEVRVRDGELQLRPETCPTFFSRYIDSDPFEGEWWATGDHVSQDEDGYLWFEARADDVIVSAGYRIGPFEVESALLTHPASRRRRSSPRPTRNAARSCAPWSCCARATPAPSSPASSRSVKGVTAPYKYPRVVEFADSLPKTSSGKIRRAALRVS